MVQQSIVKAYRKSQSLIEESYEKSLIKLVEITGLLFVKSETQESVQKKNNKKLRW